MASIFSAFRVFDFEYSGFFYSLLRMLCISAVRYPRNLSISLCWLSALVCDLLSNNISVAVLYFFTCRISTGEVKICIALLAHFLRAISPWSTTADQEWNTVRRFAKLAKFNDAKQFTGNTLPIWIAVSQSTPWTYKFITVRWHPSQIHANEGAYI